MEKKIDYRVSLTQKMFKTAFLKLLQQKPVQDITIRELCLEAGVNRGTFYSHYEDIYDLLHKIEDSMFNDLKQTMMSLPNMTAYEFYVELFRLFENNSELCTVLIGRNSDKDFVDKILEYGKTVFIAIYQNGELQEEILTYYYHFIAGGCISMLRLWIDNGMSQSPEVMAHLLEKMINQQGYHNS